MYKILVMMQYSTTAGASLSTQVVEFETVKEANFAARAIVNASMRPGISANFVKLFDESEDA